MESVNKHTDILSDEGKVFTDLILETFRLNGRLLAAGDKLTSGLHLSSARWQVLGEIVDGPFTVAQIARNMGLKRQSVQRIANILAEEGLAEFVPNPNHRRAYLVKITERGRSKYEAAMQLQGEWANRIASSTTLPELKTTVAVMRTLRKRLEEEEGWHASFQQTAT
jgi:DNA-binding MarR family transcriptional regulator